MSSTELTSFDLNFVLMYRNVANFIKRENETIPLAKFPPHRKDEFLTWIKITQNKSDWFRCLQQYLSFYKPNNWREMFDFVMHFSMAPVRDAAILYQNGLIPVEWIKEVIMSDGAGIKRGSTNYAIRILQLIYDVGDVDSDFFMKAYKNVPASSEVFENIFRIDAIEWFTERCPTDSVAWGWCHDELERLKLLKDSL